jgi:mandelate racemase
VIDAAPLVLIDVTTDQGVTGRAYIFAYTRLTLKPLVQLVEEIGRDLVGKAVAPSDPIAAMDGRRRRRHGPGPGLGLEWDETAVAKYLI